MTLPKGFGAGGGSGSDVEKMIGRRTENMLGLFTAAFIAAWLATFGGTAVGYYVYPWAYPSQSGHFAFIVLSIIEGIGYLFCVKIGEEGSRKSSNGVVAATLAGVAVATALIVAFLHG